MCQQQILPDKCILDWGQEVERNILDKDIHNLSAFLSWATKNCFVASGLEVKKVKVPQKPIMALSPQQVRGLLTALSKYPALRRRVLLAVTTAL